MLAIVWVLYHLQRKGYLRSSQYIMVFRSTSTVIRLAAMCLYRALPRICRRLTKEESTSAFHVFSVYAIPCSSQLLLWLSFHLGPVSVRDEQPSNVVSIQHVLKTYMEGICTTYRNVSMLLSWRREQASTSLLFPLGMVTTLKELFVQLKHMKFIHIYTVHSCSASEMQAPKSPTYIGLVKEDLYFRFVIVSMLAMWIPNIFSATTSLGVHFKLHMCVESGRQTGSRRCMIQVRWREFVSQLLLFALKEI